MKIDADKINEDKINGLDGLGRPLTLEEQREIRAHCKESWVAESELFLRLLAQDAQEAVDSMPVVSSFILPVCGGLIVRIFEEIRKERARQND